MHTKTIAITEWNCISPYGIGVEALAQGLASGRAPDSDFAPHLEDDETKPFDRALIAVDFDIRAQLGKKGTRGLDRLTGLCIATIGLGQAVSELEDRSRVGIALGSSQGSLKSIAGFTRESLRYERPDFVNPTLFPNTVMNCAAGQAAIWHKCRGVNATMSAGRLSSLAAIRYAALTLHFGYADLMFAGGAEEMTAPNAWAYFKTTEERDRYHAPLAEGCAMFALETSAAAQTRRRRVLAELSGSRLGTYKEDSPNRLTNMLSRAVENLLIECEVSKESVDLVCKSQFETALAEIETEAVLRTFGKHMPEQIAVNELLGNPVSATAAFQLGILLLSLAKGGYGLLLSLDGTGTFGALLVRRGG